MKKISTSIPTIIKNSQPTKKIQKDLPPSVVVFQHNNLIEARYSLTLQEKKIILWLTSQIKPDDKDFKKHMLTVREFMNLMELKGHANYKELQKITLGLMKKVLIIGDSHTLRLASSDPQETWQKYCVWGKDDDPKTTTSKCLTNHLRFSKHNDFEIYFSGHRGKTGYKAEYYKDEVYPCFKDIIKIDAVMTIIFKIKK